jgi:vitamin B12/bleomycin/antimicrobial peptide transport system ATP-binding/permease protein
MPSFTKKARIADDSTIGQMRFFWRMLDGPKTRHSVTKYFGLIALVIGANAFTQVRLNNWQGNIYDAIGKRDVSIFAHEIGVFLVIVSALLCLGVLQTWFHERLKVRLRLAATVDLLDEWLKPARAFLLPLSGEISINPDQRIQEDTRRLSELTVDLAVGLVQSTLMLLAFVGVLWELSAQVVFLINDKPVSIPGYMVWAAIGYAALGSFVTWLVGKPLIKAHSQLRSAEATFRVDLVHLNESAEGIALSRGEEAERALVSVPLNNVLSIMRRIANRLAALTWVTGAYGWIAILAPLVLAAPGYFGGTLSLGGLMMVVGAFYQVQTALRWYVDRFPALAEWRAMLSRVIDYRTALEKVHTLDGVAGRIHYYPSQTDALSLENLCVFAPNGRVSLAEKHVTIKPGERVLIVAAPKSGKTTFVKALAGLWVWGTGVIRLPKSMMFLPQKPYFPEGSLRVVLAYPNPPGAFSEAEERRALERVHLSRLTKNMDVEKRWDKELSLDEQRRLNMARVLLHRPLWIIKDESISELDDETRGVVLSLFEKELAHTGCISIGRHDPSHGFYQRTLTLKTRLPGLRLPLRFDDKISGQGPEKAESAEPRQASCNAKAQSVA